MAKNLTLNVVAYVGHNHTAGSSEAWYWDVPSLNITGNGAATELEAIQNMMAAVDVAVSSIDADITIQIKETVRGDGG